MTSETESNQQRMAELAEKARKWIASSEGKQMVQRVITEAQQAQDQLQQVRRPDPEALNEPVTL